VRRRYITADVFTDRPFGGNPLAVVLDAEGLATETMQNIAREFGYSETTFVLPPADPSHTACVRIFTPVAELPFAGHPNVGTAMVLARHGQPNGGPIPDTLVFEERAGLVPVALTRDAAGIVVQAELTAPEPLSRGAAIAPAGIAACLSLPVEAIATARHAPCPASVGLRFVFAELADRAALSAAIPDLAAFRELLAGIGVGTIFCYAVTEQKPGFCAVGARMFSPIGDIYEDPATGSASAALAALLGALSGGDAIAVDIRQGEDMGRPSRLAASATREADGWRAKVGGTCVEMMQGTIEVD